MPTPTIPALIAVLAFALTSCTTTEYRRALPAHHSESRSTLLDAPGDSPGFSYWSGYTVKGSPSITIDLSEQAAYFYKNGDLVARSRVATGRAGHTTPTGNFRISDKKINKESNLYGTTRDRHGRAVNTNADSRRHRAPAGGSFDGADMPYWMRLTSYGIGMHAGPIPDPGQPASHGCIRLPAHMARLFYYAAPEGTPVKIKR